MYANILQGPKGGILAGKTVLPRFPVSSGEIERLLGFTLNRGFVCQEASGNLLDIKTGSFTLNKIGSPLYQKPLRGLPEFGVECPTGANIFLTVSAADFPGTSSFFALWYGEYNGGAIPAVNVLFGPFNNGGTGYIRLQFTDATYAKYRAQAIDSTTPGSYAADLTSSPVPTDTLPRAMAIFYDASTGLFYYLVSGASLSSAGSAGWDGLAANVGPSLILGGWPTAGSNTRCRYALWAFGASLDGKGAQLATIFRRFGWQ